MNWANASRARDPGVGRLDQDRRHADGAYDLDPEDPFIQVLADRAVGATRDRYDLDKLPGQDIASDIPTLIQSAVNASSPAWQRLDTLIRQQLH